VQFTRLRLSGFKSFVDPTDFMIQPGLTGVVGPNGCGKSNLVEALRWVMGENSAKKMRGGSMDDVIFAGTNQRPSRNFAEVSLLLDNRERRAPSEFNEAVELEVSRRIERESGSAYSINGREVRWRDVQLMFADLATGPHSTAMVSQGRVGALINAKPTERRALLEEAAGISGLHQRRHEAELRLKAAETNLSRLEDVTQQLDQQLQSLKRQARQASRYRNLSGHIRKAEAIMFHLRYAASSEALAQAQERLRQAELAVAQATEEAARASSHQAGAAEAVPPFRHREAEAAAKLHRLEVARDGLEAEERRAREQQAQLQARLGQIESDVAREEAQRRDAESAIARLDAESAEIEAQRAGESEAEQAAAGRAEGLAGDVQRAQGELDQATEKAAQESARRNTLSQQIGGLRQRMERLAARARDIAAEKAKLEAESDELSVAGQAAETATAREAEVETARQARDAREQSRVEAQAAEQKARDLWQELQSQTSRLAAEEKGLARLLAVNEDDLWPPLIDALTVAPGYEIALGAALGDDLAVATDEASPKHWRVLPPLAEAPALPSGVEPLSNFVTAPPALARRLSQIGVLANAADGPSLQAELKQGQRLVSKSGGFWRWDGLCVKPGAPTSAAVRLEQRNRLADLRDQLAGAEAKLNDARTAYDAARQATMAAQQAEQEGRATLRRAEQLLAEAREQHARALQRSAARATRLAALNTSAEQIAADETESRGGLGEFEAQIATLPPEAETRARVAELRRGVEALRTELGDARGRLDQVRREAEGRRRRLGQIEGERRSWAARVEGADRQIGALAERRSGVVLEIEAIANLPAEIAEKRRLLLDEIQLAEVERQQAADALAAAEQALAECDRRAREAQETLGLARETRVRAEAEAEHSAENLKDLSTRIREALDCAPEDCLAAGEVSDDEEMPDLPTVELRLERLKKERDGMGPVNLRADMEAQEVETQLESLRSEREDLERAIARLRHGIGELNKEGRERLVEAFKQVDAHFQTLFTKVFGGGRAHLAMTESDDPLEAGLEIMAQPPGKKLQVMSLLSGGEQALTAMSLLFAVFLTNPAPICVLDEVDAPLDDSNVERFCDLLDDIIKMGTTRFLVVTHHPITMARMDRLFGVTMAERGVSQLVSVDLNAAQQLVKPQAA